MTVQDKTTRPPHCLLCIAPVKQQGDVCPQCHPRSRALGRILIEYAGKLEPILLASPRRHISAPMRFVPDTHFYLKELDAPIPHEKLVITHRLTLISFDKDNLLQQERWYGHNIPSTFMAATVDQGRFPEEPDYARSGRELASGSACRSAIRQLGILAEGGYLIDLRPLEDNPRIDSWVWSAPLSNGRIEGTEIDRLSESARQSAQRLMSGLKGAFQDLAAMAAHEPEPVDGGASPFDSVSSSYTAFYWYSRGARVGKRVGDAIRWMDGKEQPLSEIR